MADVEIESTFILEIWDPKRMDRHPDVERVRESETVTLESMMHKGWRAERRGLAFRLTTEMFSRQVLYDSVLTPLEDMDDDETGGDGAADRGPL